VTCAIKATVDARGDFIAGEYQHAAEGNTHEIRSSEDVPLAVDSRGGGPGLTVRQQ
jgi:hypothetical protein